MRNILPKLSVGSKRVGVYLLLSFKLFVASKRVGSMLIPITETACVVRNGGN